MLDLKRVSRGRGNHLRHHHPLIGCFQICDQLFGVDIDNAGANRHLDQQIFTLFRCSYGPVQTGRVAPGNAAGI